MRSQTLVQIGFAVVLTANGASVALAAGKDHGDHKEGKTPKAVAAMPAKEKDMVVIPRGEFTMGSKEHADEPAHQVVLDAYAIDKYEVSNEYPVAHENEQNVVRLPAVLRDAVEQLADGGAVEKEIGRAHV